MIPLSPRDLPEVTAVEVVDLRGVLTNRVTEYMRHAHDAPCKRCEDELVARIADAWRALPQGEPIRCHTPPVGLRFYMEMELLAEASICWRCQNIYGDFQGREFGYSFDATSTAARKLFELVVEIIGADVLEGE